MSYTGPLALPSSWLDLPLVRLWPYSTTSSTRSCPCQAWPPSHRTGLPPGIAPQNNCRWWPDPAGRLLSCAKDDDSLTDVGWCFRPRMQDFIDQSVFTCGFSGEYSITIRVFTQCGY